MNGAKIYNLGLSLLIRLSLFVEYLSFLGGEAQRPFLNNRGRTISAYDPSCPIPFNFKTEQTEFLCNKSIENKELLDFCPLHEILLPLPPSNYEGEGFL